MFDTPTYASMYKHAHLGMPAWKLEKRQREQDEMQVGQTVGMATRQTNIYMQEVG